jgi:uncharacterized membrane protein (UPF0127 family)
MPRADAGPLVRAGAFRSPLSEARKAMTTTPGIEHRPGRAAAAVRAVLLALAVLCGYAGAGAAGEVTYELTELWIETAQARHRFEVELAETAEQRARGLMFRTELADDAGMLFAYDRPDSISMWMKNTLIPLDMLFVDEDGTISRIEAWTAPLSLEIIPSGGPVWAVLELKGGITERLGIEPDDRIVHPIFDR